MGASTVFGALHISRIGVWAGRTHFKFQDCFSLVERRIKPGKAEKGWREAVFNLMRPDVRCIVPD